jgi:hypothetical protein
VEQSEGIVVLGDMNVQGGNVEDVSGKLGVPMMN